MASGWDRGGIKIDSHPGRRLAPRCCASAVGYWGREGLTGEHQVVRRNTHTAKFGGFSLGLMHGRIEAVGVVSAGADCAAGIAVVEEVGAHPPIITAERCG